MIKNVTFNNSNLPRFLKLYIFLSETNINKKVIFYLRSWTTIKKKMFWPNKIMYKSNYSTRVTRDKL